MQELGVSAPAQAEGPLVGQGGTVADKEAADTYSTIGRRTCWRCCWVEIAQAALLLDRVVEIDPESDDADDALAVAQHASALYDS
jgi:hypothetical protein